MGIKGFPLIPVVGLDKIITHGGWIQKRNLGAEWLLWPKRTTRHSWDEESLTKGVDYNIKC